MKYFICFVFLFNQSFAFAGNKQTGAQKSQPNMTPTLEQIVQLMNYFGNLHQILEFIRLSEPQLAGLNEKATQFAKSHRLSFSKKLAKLSVVENQIVMGQMKSAEIIRENDGKISLTQSDGTRHQISSIEDIYSLLKDDNYKKLFWDKKVDSAKLSFPISPFRLLLSFDSAHATTNILADGEGLALTVLGVIGFAALAMLFEGKGIYGALATVGAVMLTSKSDEAQAAVKASQNILEVRFVCNNPEALKLIMIPRDNKVCGSTCELTYVPSKKEMRMNDQQVNVEGSVPIANKLKSCNASNQAEFTSSANALLRAAWETHQKAEKGPGAAK